MAENPDLTPKFSNEVDFDSFDETIVVNFYYSLNAESSESNVMARIALTKEGAKELIERLSMFINLPHFTSKNKRFTL